VLLQVVTEVARRGPTVALLRDGRFERVREVLIGVDDQFGQQVFAIRAAPLDKPAHPGARSKTVEALLQARRVRRLGRAMASDGHARKARSCRAA
jgi:hypothetical protein